MRSLNSLLIPNQFDYRVLHRGLANKSKFSRPVFCITFAKPGFADILNIPSKSMFDCNTEKLVFSKNSFEQFQKDVVSRYYRKGKGNIQVQAETLQAAEDFTNATRKYPNSDRSKRFTKANL